MSRDAVGTHVQNSLMLPKRPPKISCFINLIFIVVEAMSLLVWPLPNIIYIISLVIYSLMLFTMRFRYLQLLTIKSRYLKRNVFHVARKLFFCINNVRGSIVNCTCPMMAAIIMFIPPLLSLKLILNGNTLIKVFLCRSGEEGYHLSRNLQFFMCGLNN